eukprot:5206249-Amphidinium_carterae.2
MCRAPHSGWWRWATCKPAKSIATERCGLGWVRATNIGRMSGGARATSMNMLASWHSCWCALRVPFTSWVCWSQLSDRSCGRCFSSWACNLRLPSLRELYCVSSRSYAVAASVS